MAYPSVVATLTNPNAGDRLNAPSHSSIHSAVNNEVVQMETFIGTLSSTQGTLIYDIRAAASNGGGHIQTANVGGTGQTSYTKGDLLIATSASVLSKFAIGSVQGYALVVDSTQAGGVRWGVPNSNPTITVYSTPSTLNWVKPSVLSYIVVEMVGGGAGSEVRASSPPAEGGGGAGGYAKKVIPASLLQATETVIIGIGGLQSSVGGATSFGTTSYLTAKGGQVGVNGVGGSGGTASGDISFSGFSGGNWGNTAGGIGGNGGSSPLGFGMGGAPSVVGGAGLNGQGYGAGGAGNLTGNAGTGTGGIVIITAY